MAVFVQIIKHIIQADKAKLHYLQKDKHSERSNSPSYHQEIP